LRVAGWAWDDYQFFPGKSKRPSQILIGFMTLVIQTPRRESAGRPQKSLALGNSRPLPELFQAAGCKYEFREKTFQPLAKMLPEELAKL